MMLRKAAIRADERPFLFFRGPERAADQALENGETTGDFPVKNE